MVCNSENYCYWTLFIVRYSIETVKNTTFRKLDLFPSSGERTQQRSCLPPLHLRTEIDSVPETLCSLVLHAVA
jgi:hypothetical protein